MELEILQVPLFPLPGMVFFPHSLIRLHIFEERYREMTRDCLDGSSRMMVGMLKPGWEPNYYESPQVYRVAGVGRIVDYYRRPDGKYDLTLEGIGRAMIRQELNQKPYRVVEAEMLNGCLAAEDSTHEIHRHYRALLATAERMVNLLPQFKGTLQKIRAAHPHPGVVADLLAHYFVDKAYEKQCILEEENCPRRIQLVNIQLQQIIENYSRVHFRDRL